MRKLRMTERILRRAGYGVIAAASPTQALEVASAKPAIDLIVCDIVMPVMDGVRMVELLTGILGPRPVLFISGYADSAFVATARSRPGPQFLAKPFSATELMAAARSALAGRGAEAAERSAVSWRARPDTMPPMVTVYEVFTPAQPARETFVARGEIGQRLASALKTPGQQIVIFGHSGSGKSTLLVNTAEALGLRMVTTSCRPASSFDALVAQALGDLELMVDSTGTVGASKAATARGGFAKGGIEVGVDFERGRTSSKATTLLAPRALSAQQLARALIRTRAIWVVEDFHRLPDSERILLAQSLKTFVNESSVRGEDAKIVVVGAVGSADELITIDSEMRRRLAQIHVPLMTAEELEDIIKKGGAALRVNFQISTRREIARLSNGLASSCHAICLRFCLACQVEGTQPRKTTLPSETITEAVRRYVEDQSETVRVAFDLAFKQVRRRRYNNGRIIVEALAKYDDGATQAEIYDAIRETVGDYPHANVKRYLQQLSTPERGEVLRFDARSGKWSFSDPAYRVYAMALLQQLGVPVTSWWAAPGENVILGSLVNSAIVNLTVSPLVLTWSTTIDTDVLRYHQMPSPFAERSVDDELTGV